MRNFIAKKPENVMNTMGNMYSRYGGMLVTPSTGYSRASVSVAGVWAMDNDCFNQFDPAGILRMYEKYQGIDGCVFALAPDSVGDALQTLIMFAWWEPVIRVYGYPVGLAIQNGQQDYDIPWAKIDAVFIAGDTAFKLSDYAASVVVEAKRRGKWTHMGRVNSHRRIQYAASIGCDSFDGSGYARFPHKIRPALAYQQQRQLSLWSA